VYVLAQRIQPEKYAGEWHEVARLPNFFERNLVAAKATYELQKDGKISVHNEGVKQGGERTSICGLILERLLVVRI